MINRKKPVLTPDKRIWKPKSKVWFGKNDDSELGNAMEINREEFDKAMDTWEENKKRTNEYKEGLALGIRGGIELKRARKK